MKKYLKWFIGISCLYILFSSMAKIVEIPDPLEQRLQNDLLISQETALNLKNIFLEIGIDDYDTIINDPLLDNAHGLEENGYRLNTGKINNVIIYLHEELPFFKVKYANQVLYTDGKANGKLTDYMLTEERKTELQFATRNAVTQALMFPETAKFPLIDGWKYAIINEEEIVQGYVESENALKQTLKTEFQAKYKAGAMISLIVGDQEYIKK